MKTIPASDALELLAQLVDGSARLHEDLVDRLAARVDPSMTVDEIEREIAIETQRAGGEHDDLLASLRAKLPR